MTHGSTCSGPGMANLVYSLGPEAQLLCSTLHAMRGPKGSDRAIPRPRPHRKPQHNLKIYSLHSQRENTDKRQAAHAHAGKVQDKRDVNSIPSDFCKENPPANGNLIAGECSPKKPVPFHPTFIISYALPLGGRQSLENQEKKTVQDGGLSNKPRNSCRLA
jgi:hypothetical protein